MSILEHFEYVLSSNKANLPHKRQELKKKLVNLFQWNALLPKLNEDQKCYVESLSIYQDLQLQCDDMQYQIVKAEQENILLEEIIAKLKKPHDGLQT